ncbi:MAG TPA: Ig-like domain-containing protein [Gemmatimonadaceae bacterium]|nr:Ig-like domain-containing protein [Gemmatimonadaceae bacterium]
MQASDAPFRPDSRTLTKRAWVALLVLAVACGGSSDMTGPGPGNGGGGNPAPVASVAVSPATANLLVGVVDSTTLGTVVIAPTVKDASGNVLSGRTITWSSSAPAVATVSSTGSVSAVGPGTASIMASSGGQSGQVSVTVTRPAVDTIKVTPLASTIKVGASETLVVSLLDAQGHALSGGRAIVEFNNSPSIITASGGTITGVAPGTGTISYNSENNTVTVATITVTQ